MLELWNEGMPPHSFFHGQHAGQIVFAAGADADDAEGDFFAGRSCVLPEDARGDDGGERSGGGDGGGGREKLTAGGARLGSSVGHERTPVKVRVVALVGCWHEPPRL